MTPEPEDLVAEAIGELEGAVGELNRILVLLEHGAATMPRLWHEAAFRRVIPGRAAISVGDPETPRARRLAACAAHGHRANGERAYTAASTRNTGMVTFLGWGSSMQGSIMGE